MDKYTHKAVNKTYISSEEIQARLDRMKELDVKSREPEFNLFVINTPSGQLKIKSKLSLEEWTAKYKKNAKKKNLNTFIDTNETTQSIIES